MIVHYTLVFLKYRKYFEDRDELNQFVAELQAEGCVYKQPLAPKTFWVTEDDGETIIEPKGD